MSLDTLLEAAKYLEFASEAKARGEDPPDYNTYSQLLDNEVSQSQTWGKGDDDSPSNGLSDDSSEVRRNLGAGTREVHNKLEKNRRAHLKECFDLLKKQIPSMDDKKTSNLAILRTAYKYIQILKRKDRELEHEMEELARAKIAYQQRLAFLRRDLSLHNHESAEFNSIKHEPDFEEDSNSTSTASECGPMTDMEDEKPESFQVAVTVPGNSATSSSPLASATLVPLPSFMLAAPSKLAIKMEPSTPICITTSSATSADSQQTIIKPKNLVNDTMVAMTSSITVVTPSISTRPVLTYATVATKMNQLATAASIASPVCTATLAPLTLTSTLASIAQHQAQRPTTFQVPVTALQSLGVAKNAAAIAMSGLRPQVATTTHLTQLQMAAQVVTHSGLQMNGNTSIITGTPTTVQVLQPAGVRVISATPTATIPVSLTTVGTASSVVTAPKPSVGGIGKGPAIPGIPISGAAIPTMTLAKPGLIPVTMTTMATQPVSLTQAKGIMTNATGMPVTVTKLTMKAAATPGITRASALVTHGTPMTAHVNNLPRHIVTTALKSGAQVRSTLSQITHVVQSPITSVSQLVAPGSQVSTVGQLMAPVSVMNHAAMAQVLSAQPGHIIKSMGPIPLVPQQFLQTAQPVVMVTAPSIAPPATATPLTVSIESHPQKQVTISGSRQ